MTFFELVYVMKGTAVHTLNKEEGVLTEGDYFIMDYGSVHSYAKVKILHWSTVFSCLRS